MIYAIAFCVFTVAGGDPAHCQVLSGYDYSEAVTCRVKLSSFIKHNNETLKYMCVTREAGGWRQIS